MNTYFICICSIVLLLCGCRKPIKKQSDEIYSRHLQQHLQLSIYSTPVPDTKSDMHLLLVNDGQELDNLDVMKILDSLYTAKIIQPLIIVGIHPRDREQEYGVSGFPDYQNRGSKADKYAQFIDNELYTYVKKKAGLRKFSSVGIAGFSQGGLSAFDVAWDNADKIDKVGVFSGSFWWRNIDTSDSAYSDDKNRILLNKIRSSRKKPHLKYWFYAGGKEENSDRDKDGIIDVIDDTRDLVTLIKSKNICSPNDIVYTEDSLGEHDYHSWKKQFPSFLIWAFGRK